MDRHFDAAFLTDGDDFLQKMLEITPQVLVSDALVFLKQLFDFPHALRFPARHGVAVGILVNFAEHILRTFALNLRAVVGQAGCAVRKTHGEIGARPVEDGHEVIADDLHSGLCQVSDGGFVGFDILLGGRRAQFDILMDIDALNAFHREPRGLDLRFHLQNAVERPGLSRWQVVQGGNHTRDAWYLPDLLEGDGVLIRAEPAHCHLHAITFFFHLYKMASSRWMAS